MLLLKKITRVDNIIAKPPHSGNVTHHQDQVATTVLPVSFNTKNTRKSTCKNVKPNIVLFLFSLILHQSKFIIKICFCYNCNSRFLGFLYLRRTWFFACNKVVKFLGNAMNTFRAIFFQEFLNFVALELI